jgi:hypothetical protein
MDTKKSLIILGSVAAAGAALYFILKPSSAKAATTKKTPSKKTDAITDPCIEFGSQSYACVVSKGGGGIGAPYKTKDCVVSTFNCVSTTNETIQIPLSANCMDYQPAKPQCAPPMGGGYKVAPDLYGGGLVDNDAYYSEYYGGYYTPSGGLPYSGGRPPKGQYLVDNVRNSGYYSDYAMRPRLGGPPRGRGDYRAYQMVVRKDSPYVVAAFNRRPAYV